MGRNPSADARSGCEHGRFRSAAGVHLPENGAEVELDRNFRQFQFYRLVSRAIVEQLSGWPYAKLWGRNDVARRAEAASPGI